MKSELELLLGNLGLAQEQVEKCRKEIKKYLIGKRIHIMCDRFNGQPYGTSKPKMKHNSWIFTEHDFCHPIEDGDIVVQPPNTNASLSIKKCLVSNE